MSHLHILALTLAVFVTVALSNPCSNFYSPTFHLTEGQANPAIPVISKPAPRVTFADPTFQTCVYRATNHVADGLSGFAINDYSRRQHFNADNTLQLIYAMDAYWWIYNTTTSLPKAKLSMVVGDAEPQWHPTDPKILYYLPTNGLGMKIYSLNVLTMQTTTVSDLSARLKARWPTANAAWTRSEGSPSADGRYWCLMVDDADWQGVGVFTLDLQTNTILGYLNLVDRPDHVSMSPSGTYCVVSWLDDTSVFNRDLTNKRSLLPSSQHSDLAIGADGDDYFVALDYGSNAGDVFMLNLRTLVRTALFNSYYGDSSGFAYHVSGKGFNYPGWVLLSTYSSGGPRHWNHEKIFAVQLAASPKIYQIAHHHSKYIDYYTAPRASVNRNFTTITFTSNWGVNTNTDLDTYNIELPINAFGATAPVSAPVPTPVAAPVRAPVTAPVSAPVSAPVAQVVLIKDTFGGSLAGRVPDTTAVNRNPWTVTSGSLAVANGLVTSTVAHRAIIDAGASDVSVSVVVTFTSTGDAGLLFRYVDANNFLIFRVRASGWVVRRNLNGVVTDIASGSVAMSANAPQTIKVNGKGSLVECFINGIKVASRTESNFLNGFKHGLTSSVAQATSYDTFTVTRL